LQALPKIRQRPRCILAAFVCCDLATFKGDARCANIAQAFLPAFKI
jgi:hypothetical protein